jgi:hypothetical protein
MTRPLLPLPVRIAVAVTVTAVVLVVRLLVGVGRLGLWLLALAGFRGARLPALAATGIGVGWAATQVGIRPAVWLAVIGWAAWAGRHHRAAIAQHATVRKLNRAVQRHADALAAGRVRPPGPAPSTARTDRMRVTGPKGDQQGSARPVVRPWPDAGQSPEQSLTALGRYATTFVSRHIPPADPAPTRWRWRLPR